MAAGALANEMQFHRRPAMLQQLPVHEIVAHDRVGLPQPIQSADRDEVGRARPGSHKPDNTCGGLGIFIHEFFSQYDNLKALLRFNRKQAFSATCPTIPSPR
jgi:hypothetical protein